MTSYKVWNYCGTR